MPSSAIVSWIPTSIRNSVGRLISKSGNIPQNIPRLPYGVKSEETLYYDAAIVSISVHLASTPEYAQYGSFNYSQAIEAENTFADAYPFSEDGVGYDTKAFRDLPICRLGCTILARVLDFRTPVTISGNSRASVVRFTRDTGNTWSIRLPAGIPAIAACYMMRMMCFEQNPPLSQGIVKIRRQNIDYDLPVVLRDVNGRICIEIGLARGLPVAGCPAGDATVSPFTIPSP